MSSIIGHSLTGAFVHGVGNGGKKKGLLWLVWLVILAVAPDFEYVFPLLHKANHGGLRVSHSISFACLLPTVTIGMLWLLRERGRELAVRTIQAYIAGLSHVALDYLVGVHPMPLLWPFSDATFRCPSGMLPSAGAPSLTNFYFYRNLTIELGILLPVYFTVWIAIHRKAWIKSRPALVPLLLGLAIVMLIVSSQLER